MATRVSRDEWVFKHACDFARDCFTNMGEVRPMFVGYSRDCVYMLPMILGGDTFEEECRQEERFLAFLKLFFTRHAVDHYVCMHEGWCLKAKGVEDRQKHRGSLENHPDRIETLLVQSVSYKRKRVKIWEIHRESDSTTLVPMHKDGDTPPQCGGTFSECLPPEELLGSLTSEQREMLDGLITMSGFSITQMDAKDMPKDEDNLPCQHHRRQWQ